MMSFIFLNSIISDGFKAKAKDITHDVLDDSITEHYQISGFCQVSAIDTHVEVFLRLVVIIIIQV